MEFKCATKATAASTQLYELTDEGNDRSSSPEKTGKMEGTPCDAESRKEDQIHPS